MSKEARIPHDSGGRITKMDHNKLAELLFPHIDKKPEDYEKMYPQRQIPEGAMITRLGPSPTGFIHLGNLYGAFVDERLAHQSGGTFYPVSYTHLDVYKRQGHTAPQCIHAMHFFPSAIRMPSSDSSSTVKGQTATHVIHSIQTSLLTSIISTTTSISVRNGWKRSKRLIIRAVCF